MRVIGEARDHVLAKRLKAARRRLAPRPRPLEVLAHRLAIPAGVPRDRRNRPAPPRERVDLHIVLLSQHGKRLVHPLARAFLAACRRSVLINREGPPPSSAGPSTTSGYSSSSAA